MEEDRVLAGLVASFAQMIDDERQRSSTHDLSVLQTKVLSSIFRHSVAPSMKELAEAVHVKMPSLTVVLDKLEHEGLVERKLNSSDRRVIRATLTPAGQKIVEQSRKRMSSVYVQAIEGLSKEDKEAAIKFLRQFINATNNQRG